MRYAQRGGYTPAGQQRRERLRLEAASVALHTGDASEALCAAAIAETGWNAGAPKALATWAQVRTGAAMAYLMLDPCDGAAAQIARVLEPPPDMRMETVTRYLRTLDQMLTQPRFADTGQAVGLHRLAEDPIHNFGAPCVRASRSD